MFARFSFYDFIAVVIPGIFFLWALGTFGGIRWLEGILPLAGGIGETSVFIVIGYVAGLLLQGVSQHITEKVLLWWWGGFPSARWLLPEDQRFTRQFKMELRAALQAKFSMVLHTEPDGNVSRKEALKRNQEIFYRCYRLIEKISDLPPTFNAQYGLFRALLTTFALLIVVIAGKLLITYQLEHVFDFTAAGFGVVCAVGMMISYWRVTKRGEDFAKSVYDVFLANFGEAK